jgi:hypothetical protein
MTPLEHVRTKSYAVHFVPTDAVSVLKNVALCPLVYTSSFTKHALAGITVHDAYLYAELSVSVPLVQVREIPYDAHDSVLGTYFCK